jgi:hypothetical protein
MLTTPRQMACIQCGLIDVSTDEDHNELGDISAYRKVSTCLPCACYSYHSEQYRDVLYVVESTRSEVIDDQQPLYCTGPQARLPEKREERLSRLASFLLQRQASTFSPHALTLSPPHSRHAHQTPLSQHSP